MWYQTKLVKLLLASGADPDQIFHKERVTPILLVFQTKKDTNINLGLAKALFKAGVDANSKDGDGMTLMLKAVYRATPENQSHMHKVVQLLLDFGADPDLAHDSGATTPLHEAVRMQCPEIVTTLLRGGADIEKQDMFGKTPLDVAASI